MASTALQFSRITAACVAPLVAGVFLQSTSVRADSFEFISYTPPRGWIVANASRDQAYVRPDRNGYIVLHRSRFDNDAATAFTVTWRELVETAIPGAMQKSTPQILRGGDYAIADGSQPVELNGKVSVARLTAVVGKGWRIAIVSIASSDEAQREIGAFLDAVKFKEDWVDPVTRVPLVGTWWRDAGNYYVLYEFTAQGDYSYAAPAPQTGTYRVEGNRITLTDSTGRAISKTYRMSCYTGEVVLQLEPGGDYWARPKQPCP